jgi:ribonuclease HI
MWYKNGVDRLKINTDGSFFQSSLSGGWGYVIRNSFGEAVASAAGRVDYASNALQTEAVACLHAIHAVHDLGSIDIEVETDALLLVQALNSDDHDRAENGVLFQEIKSLYFSDDHEQSSERFSDAWFEAGAVTPSLLVG